MADWNAIVGMLIGSGGTLGVAKTLRMIHAMRQPPRETTARDYKNALPEIEAIGRRLATIEGHSTNHSRTLVEIEGLITLGMRRIESQSNQNRDSIADHGSRISDLEHDVETLWRKVDDKGRGKS